MQNGRTKTRQNLKFALCTFTFALLLPFSIPAFAQDHTGHQQGQGTAGKGRGTVEKKQTAPPAITLSSDKMQLIGVRTAVAAYRSLDRQVRTVGKVEVDETRLAFVNTKVSGWVKKLFVNFTGDRVEKGQPLLSIYSPDLVTAQEEYLLALRSRSTGTGGLPEVESSQQSLVESAKRRLQLWDISARQIEELEKAGKRLTDMTIEAPLSGIVLEKMVIDGAYVTAGMNLYRIADLSRVWIMADIYEYEVPLVKVGQQARVTLPYSANEILHAEVSFINPVLDPMTRTVKVRIAVNNPYLLLKPDMFTNVEIRVSSGPRLVIPREAVLDSGTRQIVYVETRPGTYEMRSVTLGVRGEQDVEVVKGIKKGERVVTSGNFLIDSESQLRSGQ
jgi:Cu(I)/Ag(I) efflux system membrane fusion protein